MRRLSGSKGGASPVVATVLISGIIIVAAIAIAFWMGGIATEFTRFEKIKIKSFSAVKDDSPAQFNITIQVQNLGTADGTMIAVYLNGKNPGFYGASHNIPHDGLTIEMNQIVFIEIYIPTSQMESGTDPEIMLHSAAGKDYPVIVPLP
jgi:hypothetical protein